MLSDSVGAAGTPCRGRYCAALGWPSPSSCGRRFGRFGPARLRRAGNVVARCRAIRRSCWGSAPPCSACRPPPERPGRLRSSAAGTGVRPGHPGAADLNDEKAFARTRPSTPTRNTPGANLLTGLRGKDVIVAFVESYGRVAVQGAAFSPQVDAVLDAGDRTAARPAGSRPGARSSPHRRSAASAGWPTRRCSPGCGWTTSSATTTLVASDRLTLSQRVQARGLADGRRTSRPTERDWPEGRRSTTTTRSTTPATSATLGPRSATPPMPDQYILSAFQRHELASPTTRRSWPRSTSCRATRRGHRCPTWSTGTSVGDGSVFDGMPAQGDRPKARVARPEQGAGRLRAVHRVLAEHPHLVRADLRRQEPRARRPRRPPARRDRLRATARTTTCRSPSSPTTRRCWTGSPAGAGRTACGPHRGPGLADGRFRDRFLTAFGPQPSDG